jgi:hypothetical protein
MEFLRVSEEESRKQQIRLEEVARSKTARTPSQNDIADTKSLSFDVFLCHNAVDKSRVKEIGKQLKTRGIRPWFDEWNLVPGEPWQESLEKQIKNIKSVAVFVGSSGIGPWQNMEINAFLRQCIKRNAPVIPVILPDCERVPQLPVFLQGRMVVG